MRANLEWYPQRPPVHPLVEGAEMDNLTPDLLSRAETPWRVVATRKDIAAPRFERMVIPTEPALPWPSCREGDDGKGSQNAER